MIPPAAKRILLTFLLFAGVALSPAQNKTHLTGSQAEQRQAAQEPGSPISPLKPIIQDDKSEPAGGKNQENRSDDREPRIYRVQNVDPQWHFWLPFWLNLVIAIVGLVTVVAVFGQLRALIVSQRAWVIFTPDVFDAQKETFGTAAKKDLNQTSLALKNVGPTPAHIVSVSLRYVQLPSLVVLPLFPNYAEPRDRSGLLLVPADSTNELASLEGLEGNSASDFIPKLADRSIVLYVFGYVQYRDSFNRFRETRVGYVFEYLHLPVGSKRIAHRAGPPGYNRAT